MFIRAFTEIVSNELVIRIRTDGKMLFIEIIFGR